jgi:type I restriction enzyme R subunit
LRVIVNSFLDFFNEAEDIYTAFKPYYDATGLQETSDPAQLDRLKHELDAMQPTSLRTAANW